MKFFGKLKHIDLISLDEEEKIKLYTKRRLFAKRHVYSVSLKIKANKSNNNFKVVLEPKRNLFLDYYGFLKDNYIRSIKDECMLYLHPFNEITFGMEKMDVKRVARQYYLHIAGTIKEKSIKWVRFDPTAKGTKRIVNSTPLEDCYDKRTTLAMRAIQEHREGMEHFLMSKKEYFNSKLIDTVPIINELIKFEGGLQSILALNEDFSFEEDVYFNVNMAKEIEPLDSVNRMLGKKSKKATMPTDQEAKEYLINTLFRKRD
ncbi:hypothetical protein [Maribacter flavus]|uniref:Uncharacterized protein n=1 Tax=Maribacter flavus TaxID=1658664 RepID=A0A5B2TS87_9FLAO|nr:hypothetical protein [Maribacter flavus]KAA2217174.1 hypothetical protein F0361_14510 [Maribacter flavus]